jgi:hypothetical protein
VFFADIIGIWINIAGFAGIPAQTKFEPGAYSAEKKSYSVHYEDTAKAKLSQATVLE